MKIPIGSVNNLVWVDIEKFITILKNPQCSINFTDILIETYIKGDPSKRFLRVSKVWSFEKLIMTCDLNGIEYDVVDSMEDMFRI